MALKCVDFENIGELTRLSRKEAGLSQLVLGEKLGYGNAQFISNLERGICGLPKKKMKKFCKILKVSSNDLVRVMAEDYEAKLWRALK